MNLFTFIFYNFIFNVFSILFSIIILIVILYIFDKVRSQFNFSHDTEISEEKLGIGSNYIKFKPNKKDKEIAYKLWVELYTRKLGIPLDMENDVIYEVYNSWYEFFRISRNLLKEFPMSKLNNKNSTVIINITIRILNGDLRNHLTKWQAKFRRWYELELENNKESSLSPQDIQKKFPEYNELVKDMKTVNSALVNYVNILHKIVFDNK